MVGQNPGGVGGRLPQLLEQDRIDVVDGVAGLVVAGVAWSAGFTAEVVCFAGYAAMYLGGVVRHY